LPFHDVCLHADIDGFCALGDAAIWRLILRDFPTWLVDKYVSMPSFQVTIKSTHPQLNSRMIIEKMTFFYFF
jgi:hypothetical protein